MVQRGVNADQGPAWLRFGAHLLGSLSDSPGDGGGAASAATLRDELADELADELETATTFSIITANARLDRDDVEVLALLAAAEITPDLHRDVAALQGDAAKNRVSLGTVMRAFGSVDGHRGVLSLGPESALARAAMVDVVPDGPWSDHTVALHPTVVWALTGDASPDPDAPRVRMQLDVDDGGGRPLTAVTGPDRRRRRDAAIEATAGTRFLVVDAPVDAREWKALVREATLTGSSVVVEVDEALGPVGRTWIERSSHIAWAISSPRDLPMDDLPDRAWWAVVAPPTPPTDSEWSAAFGDHVDRSHRLTAAQLADASRAFAAFDGDLDAAVRRIVSGRLDGLATRIRPTRTWGDIVLSPERTAVLRSIVDRYLNAHRVFEEWGFAPSTTAAAAGNGQVATAAAAPGGTTGTVALFTGPSGTGKTLASEIIAGELGLDVFKLDLSAIVSKYIGETEKNLEQVFEAATSGNLVLFFDEADALFGKRSEVRDARDRYANIEVSYLLQRLETYDGLVIMATNFEKNIDDAFLRRIHVRLEFAVPGPDERRSIWERNIPDRAPIGDLDLDELAQRFELSGGLIRNAAVHAAFLAAAEHRRIDTNLVVRGIAAEYRKVGRLVRHEEFGEYASEVGLTNGR